MNFSFKNWFQLQEAVDPQGVDPSDIRLGVFNKNDSAHQALYFDHEGTEYVTYFAAKPLKDTSWADTGNKYYMVSFQPVAAGSGSEAWQKTGAGGAQNVLSKVLAGIQQFVQNNHPVIFGFEPAYPKLARLYDILIRKFASQIQTLGYERLPYDGKQVYFVRQDYKDKIGGVYGSIGPLLTAA